MNRDSGKAKKREGSRTSLYLSGSHSPSPKAKGNLWWLQFLFVFLFLLGGGIYARFGLKQAAHRLAGKDSHNVLSDSRMYESERDLSPGGYGVFPPDDSDEYPSGPDIPSGLTPPISGLKKGISGRDGDLRSGGAAADNRAGKTPSTAGKKGGQSSAMHAARSLTGMRGPGSPTAGRGVGLKRHALIGPDGRQEAGLRTGAADRASGRKGGTGSILDSLKTAWEMTFRGARDASRDTAHNWVARGFDFVPESDTAIDYPENVKKSLDRIDPNSIPHYLRDQTLSMAAAKSLQAPEVGEPVEDEDAMLKDPKYVAMKAAEKISQGLMNPLMFGGIPSISGSEDEPEAADVPEIMADPNDDPSMDDLYLDDVAPWEIPDNSGDYVDDGSGCYHYCTDTYCDVVPSYCIS